MSHLRPLAVSACATLSRLFPLSSKTGLITTGRPDKNSPVFLTCNYRLTVSRVQKALRGLDAYLLVANSRGINVWCAATGGLFRNHDVISVLKTSGIAERVNHRTVILPQLAAAGIEAKVIKKKTGWNVLWGPVHAKDIRTFVENDYRKSSGMKEVFFPLSCRIEMAIAWAFPVSIVAATVLAPFSLATAFLVTMMVWGLSFLIYATFPLYHRMLRHDAGTSNHFDFEHGGFQLLLWLVLFGAIISYSLWSGRFGWRFLLFWGILSFITVFILCLDLMGSTPVYKSGLHEDRLFKIVLDKGKCRTAGICEQVCPRNCYQISGKPRVISIPGIRRCVQCGACIVQCPFDALSFENQRGEKIAPEQMRKFKLNLLGKRYLTSE